jgi:hypothetical protein
MVWPRSSSFAPNPSQRPVHGLDFGTVMDSPPPEVIATVAAERFGDAYGGVINASMRHHLCLVIEEAIRRAGHGQRQSCVQLCLRRQALWEATENKVDVPEILRVEARSRANEAAFIADALQSAGAAAPAPEEE